LQVAGLFTCNLQLFCNKTAVSSTYIVLRIGLINDEATMTQTKLDKVVVWVHSDCLNRKGAALVAYPDAPALWVWDDALLRDWHIALHHSRFIYECLLELPVTIRRGNVVSELLHFAITHGATRVATTSTDNPGFLEICRELQANGLTVEIFEDLLMLTPERAKSFDLNVFSSLWQQASQPVFSER
jgi:hypothetical protein